MKLTEIVPAEQQIRYQADGFHAFVHFGMNTFTDREWGDGSESPVLFNPDRPDARQWAKTLKAAGAKGMILTCKHHDGFCLWPSKMTDHTVKSSPYGRDMVKEAAEACQTEGLKFGIYLSPWDRHERTYGSGKAYNDFYIAQLEELLTGYGEIFAVWLDGACGEGPNGRVQKYDWERIEETVRRLQPGACICICGPDIRWCGNEAGETRENEWSVVSAAIRDAERIQEKSQKADDGTFRRKGMDSRERDLGSREVLAGVEDLCWYPAEVNTSIRPGWFYHESEDDQVMSAEEIADLYLRSVGGNACLLLNVPPDRHGLFHERDVKTLEESGRKIREMFEGELCSDKLNGYRTKIRLKNPAKIRMLRLMEDIRQSQRVEKFTVTFLKGGTETGYIEGGCIGYQKLMKVSGTYADEIRLEITESRDEPRIAKIAVYGES